jgi:hypothetical protein
MSPFLYFIGVGASVTVNNTVNSFLDRLWWMSDVDPKRGCFLWVGTRGRGGYGILTLQGRTVSVHRLSYQSFVGPIPPGKIICHHCDVPNCWAPHHLYAGTQRQNVQDSVNRRRHWSFTKPQRRWEVASGEQHGHAKLTYQIARRMRYRYARGLSTMSELAREYGVSHGTVKQVILHQTWEKRRDRRQAKHPAC